jgi:diguanylate cyclase (GGDEF)-like protein
VLPLLHVAFFFRARWAGPLVLELIVVFASPVLYDDHPAFASQIVAFGAAALVLTLVLRLLKGGLVEARDRQRRMALADPLTGLVNRRGFDAALRAATAGRGEIGVGRRAADDQAGFALVLLDLDDFKDVNDTHGHPAGDQLLRTVAAHAAAAVRPTDTLARIGGDEFAVVAPGAGTDGAQRLALALEDAVAAAGASATVSYAVHPQDGEEGDDLLRVADRRLYAGKADRVG